MPIRKRKSVVVVENVIDDDNNNNNNNCLLCSKGPDETNRAIGLVYKKDDVRAHKNCLYFGSHLLKQETDDWYNKPDQNFFFFTTDSVKKEAQRSSQIRCAFCKKMSAAAKCRGKNCKMNYHFSCGLQNKVMFNFRDFVSFCPKHQPRQKQLSSSASDHVCHICKDEVQQEVGFSQIYCPSCKRWFHRNCIQTWAYNAGAFHMRCPTCNNVDEFKNELLKFGFELPQRDAEWAQTAYQELETGVLVRCTAKKCFCSNGRDYSTESGPYEIIICCVCGSDQGTHRGCIDPWSASLPWECETCEKTTMILEAQAMVSHLYQQRVLARKALNRQNNIIKTEIVEATPLLRKIITSSTTSNRNNNLQLSYMPSSNQKRLVPIPVLVNSILLD